MSVQIFLMKWVKCWSIGNLIIHYLADAVMTLGKCEYWTWKVSVLWAGNKQKWQLCYVVAPQRANRAENRNSEFEQIVLLRQSRSESRGVESKAEKALWSTFLVYCAFLPWREQGPCECDTFLVMCTGGWVTQTPTSLLRKGSENQNSVHFPYYLSSLAR